MFLIYLFLFLHFFQDSAILTVRSRPVMLWNVMFYFSCLGLSCNFLVGGAHEFTNIEEALYKPDITPARPWGVYRKLDVYIIYSLMLLY